jgi:hypothetical protein
MSKSDELERIWLAHRQRNLNAWRYPSKWEVAGYLGTGPIAIISFQPSGDVQFESPQARSFYTRLKENDLADAHIMDVLSSELGVDPHKEKQFFLEQLGVVDPAALLVMGNKRRNWSQPMPWVERYLEGQPFRCTIHSIYHYTKLAPRWGASWAARWDNRLREVLKQVDLESKIAELKTYLEKLPVDR